MKRQNLPRWKIKAISMFPDLKAGINEANNLYLFFPYSYYDYLDSAIKHADKRKIKKIFAFIEWCFKRKDKRIWNPAAVCFYEHLVHEKETRRLIALYMKKTIFKDIKELYKFYLAKEAQLYQEIVDEYNRVNKTTFKY